MLQVILLECGRARIWAWAIQLQIHCHLLVMLHLKLEYYFHHFRSCASIYTACNDLSFFGSLHQTADSQSSFFFFPHACFPKIFPNTFYTSLKKVTNKKIVSFSILICVSLNSVEAVRFYVYSPQAFCLLRTACLYCLPI